MPDAVDAEVITDRITAGGPAARDAAVLPRLRDERHRRPRAAGRARRPQAGAPPGAVRDVRRRLPAGPAVLQVQPRRRRRHGQVPPARRHRDLRRPGAPRPGLVAALPAGRRARATSAPRATTRPRRRGTPSARWRRSPWRWCGTSTRTPSTSATTTTAARRSPSSCPPGSRTCWSTAAPASPSAWRRTSRRTTCARSPTGVKWHLEHPEASQGGAARGAHRAHPRPGLPDRRDDPRPARHRGRVPHRPRLDHDAGGRHGRGDPEPDLPGRHRAALPGEPGQPRGQDRRPGQGRPGPAGSPTSATRPPAAPASASSSCSSATPSRRSC